MAKDWNSLDEVKWLIEWMLELPNLSTFIEENGDVY